MSGWLQSAAKVFGRGEPEPPPEVVPYDVVCRCGHHVEGERLPKFQTVPCPRCGLLLFVLPNDAYPRPKPKKTKQASPQRPTPPAIADDEDLPLLTVVEDDEDLPPSEEDVIAWADEDGRRPPRKPRPVAKPVDHAVPDSPAAPPKPRKVEPIPWGPPPESFEKKLERARIGFGETMRGVRRQLTPVRILGVVIVLAVILTGWMVRRAQSREQAEIVLRTRSELIEQLIAERDLIGLESELRDQTAASELLDRHDDQAARLGALLRETIATNHLAPGSLFDLMAEAGKGADGSDVEWERYFESSYRGKWVVLDGPIVRAADAAGIKHALLDVPLFIRGKPLRVEADLPVFESWEEGAPSVLFAAQFDSLRLPSPDSSEYVLVLAPETGFLWHRPESLAFVGLEETDEAAAEALESRLQRQQERGGTVDRRTLLDVMSDGLPKNRPPRRAR